MTVRFSNFNNNRFQGLHLYCQHNRSHLLSIIKQSINRPSTTPSAFKLYTFIHSRHAAAWCVPPVKSSPGRSIGSNWHHKVPRFAYTRGGPRGTCSFLALDAVVDNALIRPGLVHDRDALIEPIRHPPTAEWNCPKWLQGLGFLVTNCGVICQFVNEPIWRLMWIKLSVLFWITFQKYWSKHSIFE